MASPPINVGLVGYGGSAKSFNLPFILPNPDLRVCAFLQRAAAPDPASVPRLPVGTHCTIDFPSATHHRTADAFFADDKIELVVICTHEHGEFVRRALMSGKHVVVEKAFVNTSKEADDLIQLARERGKVLTVYQNRRFDSDFLTLQHLVKSGALGDIRDAQMHFDFRMPSWVMGWTQKEYAPGQGMTFGLGSHTVDQALVLFGRPGSVTGFLRSNRGVDSDVDDTFTIVLQYGGEQKNLTVTVKTAIVTHMKDNLRFFVRGTEGTYLKFGTDPQEAKALAAPCQPASDPDYGREDERVWGTLSTTKEFDAKSQTFDEDSGLYIGKYPSLFGRYRGLYENVVTAIRGTAELYVKPETSRDGLRILELARESHDTGRTVPWS
ncbi:hypothetical protein GGX14DRAFT_443956 [Mycena pura]|uniref:Uncharacterized protein n=1 Tax=Mycena pura TaxID=153505 RepID=A0AAD6VN17_9AGAR|nr:hypothetical protein GGX14DRAFT_443956 [Mycena pura]